VPLVYIGPAEVRFKPQGTLADVAPTLLTLMHLDVPAEMTGKSLVTLSALESA
jgi:2,3-bisphosphoglycerate-independent phosphoglycerate mutase